MNSANNASCSRKRSLCDSNPGNGEPNANYNNDDEEEEEEEEEEEDYLHAKQF